MTTAKLTPFGKQVRHYRIELGLTLNEMAAALTVSPSYLSSIEVGRKPLNDSLVTSISRYFRQQGVNADDLIALADRTRASIRVDTLDNQSREMVATFARRVPTLSEADRLRLEIELEKFFKGGEK